MQTIEAVFDGKALQPDLPLALEPNTRVRLTIENIEPEKERKASFLNTARSLDLNGPSDWAEQVESYEFIQPVKEKTVSFLDTARSLDLNGPADWAEHIESYLYGKDNS